MKPPTKTPPRKRNLAAKALRSPLFKPKVVADPKVHRRVKKADLLHDPDDQSDDPASE